MKVVKQAVAGLLILIALLSLSSCGCDHDFEKATCEKPATCSLCGETKGDVGDHKYIEANCETAKRCRYCNKKVGEPLGHDYSIYGVCTACKAKDPMYVDRNTVFPGKPDTLSFSMNSVGGISFHWVHDYIGSKKINYITINYTLYDAVGNPTPDDIRRKSTDSIRLIGPFKRNSTIDFTSDVFVYCDVCSKISFDSIYLEYADGTTAKLVYAWKSSVK